MTYAEKLKDPRWQKKRLEILEAAGWECSSCGNDEKTLHVHHKRYLKGHEPWEYENDQLECLCEDCHKNTTELRAKIADGLSLLSDSALEFVLGYIDAQVVFDYWDGPIEVNAPPIKFRSYEHMIGIADYCGLTEDEICAISGNDVENRGEIQFRDLKDAWLAKIKRKSNGR